MLLIFIFKNILNRVISIIFKLFCFNNSLLSIHFKLITNFNFIAYFDKESIE
jgi:hypothetical protein